MKTSRNPRLVRRGALSLSAAALVAVASAGTASAHVSTDPSTVSPGEASRIEFRVLNESPTAGTTKVELTFPAEFPVAALRTEEKAGWTAQITKVKLIAPVRINGADVTEAVQSVVWTAQPGVRIAPDQFGAFAIMSSSLPDNTEQVVIPATQTYEDGKVVKWDQPPTPDGQEPEFPAPTVKLSADASDESGNSGGQETDAAAESSGGAPLWLAGAGVGLGALALGIALGALIRSRRGADSAGK